MIETTTHLMDCGFRVVYGYTESDEISLLFHRDASEFGRKTRKLNSILAGEASAKLSLALGQVGVFDCRISRLPRADLVVDYFRWRAEDAHRNALNAHCYWLLRGAGKSARDATSRLVGLSVAEKNELLFAAGVNFNELPTWQRRGIGVYWRQEAKEGQNPLPGETTTALRRQLLVDLDLPMKDAYSEFLRELIESAHGPGAKPERVGQESNGGAPDQRTESP